MPLPAGFSALNQRDFRVFWSGQLVSLIGTWMQRVGQAWLVLELTNSAFKLGVISSLQFAPDNGQLASGSVDQTVRLWDLAATEQFREFAGHTG